MPPSAAIVESHEDRIQRLESDLPDLTTSVAQLGGKVELVSVQQRGLGEKMDTLNTMMVAHIKASAENYEKMFGRVDILEKSKLQLEGLKKFVGWAAKPGLLVIGACLIKFGEYLFTLLQHLG